MFYQYQLSIILILTTLATWGQNERMRIIPLPPRPAPIFIFDGIKLPSNQVKNLLTKENALGIDSILVLNDSIYDRAGHVTNIGIIKIYSKDSINPGAKKILQLTDGWMYDHPNTTLIINNKKENWGSLTYFKLTRIKPEDIISARIKKRKNRKAPPVMILKIKEP